MERERVSRGSGLATEDLAETHAPPGPPQDRPGAASRAPEYPGESTGARGEPPPDDAVGAPTRDNAADEAPQLLNSADEENFRTRWQQIQSEFVDDPRDAVHAADELVADVMQKLASTFAQHKQGLEGQWTRGEEVNTEELRTALRRYRSFFNRLLST
ncbi:hypothetical protein [Actinacidiphila glaucinigra]|uniref:Uncharacterized protein n=1 Tax=Actinacidiphila glaucinigra TaxID=235986 RepID=A0A239N9B6_9ACTN|nr:hypothetical protein [Actinacidiphila glaucinigra]SNT50808.1 hypothetical protein SAMN05216252_13251 [Actinacidiphila glaucinigra]